MKTLDIVIEDIIALFKQYNNWNGGQFFNLIQEYCNTNGFDKGMFNKTLQSAFEIYLATNMSSEDSIRSVLNRDKKKLGLN